MVGGETAARWKVARGALSAPTRRNLVDTRVLLVEDEVITALAIEAMLNEVGCRVVASARNLDQASVAVSAGGYDAALLDIDLNGMPSYPVAESLRSRGVPFLLATAYSATILPLHLRNVPCLRKPFDRNELREALSAAFQQPPMPLFAIQTLRGHGLTS